MRLGDSNHAQQLEAALVAFSDNNRSLPGINAEQNRQTYVAQLLESVRRVKYVAVIRERPIDARRADPTSSLFDPLKGALIHYRNGQIDEAFWLVFLFVHFGKHSKDGYRLARDVYGALGAPQIWNWARISANPDDFRLWIIEHEPALIGDGVSRRFGSHRSYESLRVDAKRNISDVFENYVRWVGANRGHARLIKDAHDEVNNSPADVFDHLYRSMSVLSFGRLAKFDYLTMLGKLGLAPISAGSPYLKGATGPLAGAKLMFTGNPKSAVGHVDLDAWVTELGNELNVGMQEMEDSLCNWQKSPNRFIPFRG